ncbi:hypothetical protein [Maricaulis sp.]|uniref:HTH domain-containing protein n=1 Tax=Maricaulis sp. TaxID=1486257 RepID=UPI003A8CE9E1
MSEIEEIGGDEARQALDSLRGYAYQFYVSALAWAKLDEAEQLYIEVAEDFAVATKDALTGVQVKDCKDKFTLRHADAAKTIKSLLDLGEQNPRRSVRLVFHSTAEVATEHRRAHRINGGPALESWALVARGEADPAPLHEQVKTLKLGDKRNAQVAAMTADEFKRDIVQRIEWHCGQKASGEIELLLRGELLARPDAHRANSKDLRKIPPLLIGRLLATACRQESRSLTKGDFDKVFEDCVTIATYPSERPENVPVQEIDEAIERRLGEIIQFRQYTDFDAISKARRLAAELSNGRLKLASLPVRLRSLAWCARILSAENPREPALDILQEAEALGKCDELSIAKAILSSESKPPHTQLLRLGTDEAVSAAVIQACARMDAQATWAWVSHAGIDLARLDAIAKAALLHHLLHEGMWEEGGKVVESKAIDLAAGDPLLLSLVGTWKVGALAVEDDRHALLSGVPFDAHRFQLRDGMDERTQIDEAVELFDRASKIELSKDFFDAAVRNLTLGLWLRLRSEGSREAALLDLRRQLVDDRIGIHVAGLAIQFDRETERTAIEQLISQSVVVEGEWSDAAVSAKLTLIATDPDPVRRAEQFFAVRDVFEHKLAADTFVGIEVETLCSVGKFAEARDALGAHPELDDTVVARATRVIAEAEGGDPAKERLRTFEQTGSTSDLQALIDALIDAEDFLRAAEYQAKLFEIAPSLRNAEKYLYAATNANLLDETYDFLDQHQELVPQSEPIAECWAQCLVLRGRLLDAIAVIECGRPQRFGAPMRRALVTAIVESGRWEALAEFAFDTWTKRAERDARELLQCAHLAAVEDKTLCMRLTYAAVAKEPSSAEVLASAYFLAANEGWEHNPEVSGWLSTAAKLSGDDGPIKGMDLETLVSSQVDWRDHERRTWRNVELATLPLSFAAQALNRPLTSLTLGIALANLNTPDVRLRGVVPAFSGNPSEALASGAKNIACDAASLLLCAHLGVLEHLTQLFERVMIPHGGLGQLFNDRNRIRFHQPSQVQSAQDLRGYVADGSISLLEVEWAAEPWLIDEAGEELASLCAASAGLSGERGEPSVVVHAGSVRRANSLGKDNADLREHADSMVGVEAILFALQKQGVIDAQKFEQSAGVLKLRGYGEAPAGPLPGGVRNYLFDRSAIQLVVDLRLVNEIVRLGGRIYVLPQVTREAAALVTYAKAGNQIVGQINAVADWVNRNIRTGRVIVSPKKTPPGEEFRSDPLAVMLATGPECDGIIFADRSLNRQAAIKHDGAEAPVHSILQVLDRLLEEGQIDERRWLAARNSLRASGVIFVPVTGRELGEMLDLCDVVEGEMIESAELRVVREYLTLISMRDWLQLPDEKDWLQGVFVSVRRTLKAQWRKGVDVSVAAAKSDWLLRLFDFREWLRFRPFDVGEVARVRALQLLLSVTDLEAAVPAKIRADFLKWAEERVIGPLKDEEPEIFRELTLASARWIVGVAEGLESDDE